MPRSRVKSEFNGIKLGGTFEQSRRGEGVCPLLFRVLGASGIRWRSGGSVTLLLLGRTTGIVKPYATAL
jgi:hypothetical protein